jgi:VanZ family protein
MRVGSSVPVWLGSRVSQRRYAIVLWSALFFWACAILWLSSLSPEDLPEAAFAFWDKLNHFAAFTVGGWLAAGAVRTSHHTARRSKIVGLAVLLIATFGLLDESLQTITPGRSGADVLDWIADVLGALTGALLNLRTVRLSSRSTSKGR